MRYPRQRVFRSQIRHLTVAAFAFLIGSSLCGVADAYTSPELPRVWVDSEFSEPAGRIILLSAQDDLQATLNEANPGDVIELEAGAVYRGPFTLPRKGGSDWIVIRTADPEGKLPQPGERVGPQDSSLMARLEANRTSVLTTLPGASHYRFVGVDIGPEKGRFINNLIDLGSRSQDVSQVPTHIVFDRCLIRGDKEVGGRRGIAMNSAHTTVMNSYISDFKEVGADSQAIAGWNGPGPFKILNNYLEGAGENVMFGGADPGIPELVPSDIEIRGNHFSKPTNWMSHNGIGDERVWTVKNLLELKNARRVLIEGNIFQHNWAHGQDGTAILFTVRNQDGRAPWSVVEDVNFINNVVRHAGNGVTILGNDNNHRSQETRRIRIANNVFYDIGAWWGRGVFLLLLDGTIDITVEHNTVQQSHNMIMSSDERPHRGFVFVRNIIAHNDYGIAASGEGVGKPSLEKYFPGSVVQENWIIGGSAERYPGGNYFPSRAKDVGFNNEGVGDFRLIDTNRSFLSQSKADLPGANFSLLCAALSRHSSTGPELPVCAERK